MAAESYSPIWANEVTRNSELSGHDRSMPLIWLKLTLHLAKYYSRYHLTILLKCLQHLPIVLTRYFSPVSQTVSAHFKSKRIAQHINVIHDVSDWFINIHLVEQLGPVVLQPLEIHSKLFSAVQLCYSELKLHINW